MKLIVGLGNPGIQYEKSRHNLGFMALEQFLKDFEQVDKTVWENNIRLKSDIVQLEWKPKIGQFEKVILVKPKTFMNNSGMAVNLFSSFYKIEPQDIWIVHDELDLPLGSMKIRFGGAAAGHHGVESILNVLGTDKFWRFRLGIGISHGHQEIAKHMVKNVEDFVLNSFFPKERSVAKKLTKRAAEALSTALEKGMETAMNRFNTK